MVLVAALSGCTEVGSLALKAQIDLGLERLATKLNELAGISTEHTAEITGDYDYVVTVNSTAKTLTEEQLVDVVIAVHDELGHGVFEGRQVSYALSVSEGTIYSGQGFGQLSDEELVTEIGYLYDLAGVYGAPLSISFAEGEGEGAYTRFINDLATPANPDWDAVLAVPDSSLANRVWGLSGVGATGALPPSEVFELAHAMFEVVPRPATLDTPADAMLIFDWVAGVPNANPPHANVLDVTLLYSAEDFTQPAASPAWPQAVRVAQLIKTAQLPPRTFASLAYYRDNGDGWAAVRFGSCAKENVGSTDDIALAEALAASGVVGAVAGLCPLG